MFFFLPYATERPRRRMPVITYLLVAANCVVYFFFELPYWMEGGEGVRPFAFVPAQPALGDLMTSMFSHANFMHLAGNMLYLWLFGTVAEDVLGPGLLLAFYFGGQMGATLLDVGMAQAFVPASLEIPRVGASGAIAGILGLSAVCFARVRVRVFYFLWFIFIIFPRTGVARVQAWVFLGLWLGYQMVGGALSTSLAAASGEATGGVAYWAHIGGFAAGMVGAMVLALPGKIRRHDLLAGVSYGEDEGLQRYADLSELVRRAPEDAQAWMELARSKQAYGFGPEAAEAYARAALLFLAQREPERAARAYQEVLRYDPAFALPASAQFDIAVGFARAGDPRQALEALERLVAAYPDSPQAEVALARAGELAERIGDLRRAADYFEALLRLFPHGSWRDYARRKLDSLRR